MVLTHFLKVQSLLCCLYTNSLCRVGRSFYPKIDPSRPTYTQLIITNSNHFVKMLMKITQII